MRKNKKIPLALSATILGFNFTTGIVVAEQIDNQKIITDEAEIVGKNVLELKGRIVSNYKSSEIQLNSQHELNYSLIPLKNESEDVEKNDNEGQFTYDFSIELKEEKILHNKNNLVIKFSDNKNEGNLVAYQLTFNNSTGEYDFKEISEQSKIEEYYENQILIEIDSSVQITNTNTENIDKSMYISLKSAAFIEENRVVSTPEEDIEASTDLVTNPDQAQEGSTPEMTEEDEENTETPKNPNLVEESLDKKVVEQSKSEVITKTETSDLKESVIRTSSSNLSEILSFDVPDYAVVGEEYVLSTMVNPSSESLYKFWIRNNSTGKWTVLKDYNQSRLLNWVPKDSGEYRLVIHVKHNYSNKEYDDYAYADLNVRNQPLSINSFDVEGDSYIGKPQLLSTSATGNGEELYKYWIQDLTTKKWKVLRNYSTDPQLEWIPEKAGRYQLVVHSKDRLSTAEYDDYTYKYVNISESKSEISNIAINGVGHAGLPITIDTSATSTNKEFYKYYIHNTSTGKWITLSDYTEQSTIDWVPKEAGRYQIVVHLKDEYSNNEYDTYSYKYITIKEPKLSIDSFSLTGAGHAGAEYFIDSSISGAENALYKYWYEDPDTGKWIVIRDYSSESKTSWVPEKAGKYKVVVHAKDNNSQLDYDDYTYRYVNVERAASNLTELNINESNYVGSKYNIKVKASSTNSSLYKYWVEDQSTQKWTVLKDWSNDTEIDWVPQKAGKYRLVVHSKDIYSQKDYDDLKYQDVVVHAPFIYQTTKYDITLSDVLDRQMTYSPQTDLYGGGFNLANREDVEYYLNPNNFIDQSLNLNETSKEVKITASTLNVRKGPSTNYSKIGTVSNNEVYEVISEQYGWYKINLGNTSGWISGNYVSVTDHEEVIKSVNMYGRVTAAALNVRKGPGTNYAVIDKVVENETMTISDESSGWFLVNINGIQGWVSGNYLNVFSSISDSMLQFLSLSNHAGTDVEIMNRELNNKGILENKGQAFIEASKKYNVNEIYLLSHALLETGNGTSTLATGVVVSEVDGVRVTPKKVYNMYGIGAFDSSPLKSGSEYAYKQGWDTPEKAIIGGAEWIAASYINNPNYKQDTLYKMRWNPMSPTAHQYATDIGWAVKQTHTLDFLVEISLRNNLIMKYDIPIYK